MSVIAPVAFVLYTILALCAALWFYSAARDAYAWEEYPKSAFCMVMCVLAVLSPAYIVALWK